jgi:hypothetical protein
MVTIQYAKDVMFLSSVICATIGAIAGLVAGYFLFRK